MDLENCTGCCTNLQTWYHDFNISETMIRYWDIRSESVQEHASYLGYIVQLIDLGNGKWLVGIQPYNELYEERSSNIHYIPLDNLEFSFHRCDRGRKV